ADQYPQYSAQIIAGAKISFLAGDQWAYLAGIIAILVGAAIIYFKYPKMDEEKRLLAQYHEEDNL
ncbi:MAG TPA: MFS transporter, partial [Methanobacterium sp.]|nr:MFS transporter [Methanobacterium sp.]